MNNPAGKPRWSFLDFFRRLFSSPKPPFSPVPKVPPDNTTEPVRTVTSRVLLVIFDPIMDTGSGIKLSQLMHWQPPDALVNTYIQDVLETSGGKARY